MILYHGSNVSFLQPDLALLFRQFERGLASVEMLVREMLFKRLTIQYSFHTVEALKAISFKEVTRVY